MAFIDTQKGVFSICQGVNFWLKEWCCANQSKHNPPSNFWSKWLFLLPSKRLSFFNSWKVSLGAKRMELCQLVKRQSTTWLLNKWLLNWCPKEQVFIILEGSVFWQKEWRSAHMSKDTCQVIFEHMTFISHFKRMSFFTS